MADTGASNLTSLDLFAGCGGLTRGLEWAGFNCIAFNEINKDAANSFAINFPEAIRLDGDIRDAVSKEVIEKVILPKTKEDGIDLVCGGPPCQGFSGIGHRRSFSVEKEDIPTNHLFQEMIRRLMEDPNHDPLSRLKLISVIFIKEVTLN